MENILEQLKLKRTKTKLMVLLSFSIIMLFQSCATQLLPKYDVNIVDSLTSSTNEIFTLFAEISEGTTATDYSKREDKYNNLLGKLEALELQIKARPVPDVKELEKIKAKVNDFLKSKNLSAYQFSESDKFPSANALEQIIKIIKKIKETDKKQGVTKTEVDVFKGFTVNYLDQALTYEKFLNPKI